MKPNRDASALAARLGAAANTPIPLPEPRPVPALVQTVVTTEAPPARPKREGGTKAKRSKSAETRPITLRPAPELLNKYVLAAAERTRETGRVVSAQEIMLAVLERGL